MFRKLNEELRRAILIVGGGIIIYNIIESLREEQQDADDGFQAKEFDDIW